MRDPVEVSLVAEVETLLKAIERDSLTRIENLDRLLMILPRPAEIASGGPPHVTNRERVAPLLARLRVGPPAADLPLPARELWERYETEWLSRHTAEEVDRAVARLQEPVAARRAEQAQRRRDLDLAQFRIEALSALADVLDRLLDVQTPFALRSARAAEVE